MYRSAFPWLHYKERSEVEEELLQAKRNLVFKSTLFSDFAWSFTRALPPRIGLHTHTHTHAHTHTHTHIGQALGQCKFSKMLSIIHLTYTRPDVWEFVSGSWASGFRWFFFWGCGVLLIFPLVFPHLCQALGLRDFDAMTALLLRAASLNITTNHSVVFFEAQELR